VTGSNGFAGWIGDLEAAFADTAQGALGIDRVEVTARDGAVAPQWQGAYLGLVGPAGAIQIGLAADEPTCQALAKRLLGMEPGEDPLPPPDMADALCEIVNIVAGAFKGKVRDRAAALQMGLPTFFRGGVQPTERTAVAVAEIRAGGAPAALLLVHPRAGEGA
jgi:CheY-specific phosphatase CheX